MWSIVQSLLHTSHHWLHTLHWRIGIVAPIFWKVKKLRLREVNILKVMELGRGLAESWSPANSETWILSALYSEEVSERPECVEGLWVMADSPAMKYWRVVQRFFAITKISSSSYFFPSKCHCLIPVATSCQRKAETVGPDFESVLSWPLAFTSSVILNFQLPFKHIKKLLSSV